MKIVMISIFPPNNGGVEKHTYTLSKKLIENGHEVFLITLPYNGKKISSFDGIHIIQANMINIPFLKELSLMISVKKILNNLIKKENIDIIHSHIWGGMAIGAIQLGNKYNIPTYMTVHFSDIEYVFNNPLQKRFAKKILNNANKLLAVSNDIIDELNSLNIKNIKEKTSLHLNAVDINKFKEITPKTKKETPTVIFVGRLAKQKNLTLLLDAKKQSKIDYKLLIVGDGPLKDNLENKVKNEKISDIKFLGHRDDIEKILPQSDLFVLPSHFEGLSIALIEALACGLPVIGSDIKGMRQIITPDVGLLFQPNDPLSLAHTIDKILSNEELYNKFKSNTRKKAMKFSEMKIPYTEITT